MDTAYQTSLEAKHAELDRKIDAESHRPYPDPMILADLKKQKLRIKEALVLH
jgi:hypothetical protein